MPCIAGDFDADGDDDYAFPGAGYDCIRRVPVRVVILEDAAVRDTATLDGVTCLYRYPASPEVGEFGEPASDRDGLMEPGEGGDTDIYLYEDGRFVHRTYPSDREATRFEDRAIHKAATTPAGRLDPALPLGERFFDWLQRICGDDCRWETELNDCGEATGDPELDRDRDLPACVSFSGRHPANVRIGIDVSVGTFEKGFVGEPRLRRVDLICGGQRQRLDAPSGLPAALDSLAGSTASCEAARSGPRVPGSRPDPGALESAPDSAARSFAEWCRDGSAASSGHTVPVLMALVG